MRGAAKTLSIEPLLDRRPRQLSGGQQQRVALGRCIVRNPKVFLFDEPLSNLDAQLRAQMRLEIKELRLRVPTTSVFVTHDQVEAMTLGDRIVVMKDGLVQQVGSPLELYRRPLNRFVASFIGSPAMNFIDMAVAAGGRQLPPLRRRARHRAAAAAFSRARRPRRPLRHDGRAAPASAARDRRNGGEQVAFGGNLMVTEQLGDEQVLAVRIGQGRHPRRRRRPGAEPGNGHPRRRGGADGEPSPVRHDLGCRHTLGP